jgi:LmbE family N-acetylglucosaminyl deacetylase
MFRRLRDDSRPQHTSASPLRRTSAYLSAILLGSAVLLLVFALQAPTAGAAGKSILIVTAHPDDDVLIASGVVANALAAGDTVRVVYLTNGDDPDPVYTDGHAKGLIRENEAVSAEAQLGLPENDLIFLGYPDGGLYNVFNAYPDSTGGLTGPSGLSATYGDRGLGGTDYHLYRFGSHALYNRPNVLADLDAIQTAYRPDDIYTTSQYDAHWDHYTAYYFVQLALLRRVAADPSYHPTLHQAIIWTPDNIVDSTIWPLALNPQTALTAPPDLNANLQWSAREDLPVPADMQSTNPSLNRKIKAVNQEMIEGGTSDFLGQFVHSDEVFWAKAQSMSVTVNGGSQYTHTTAVTLTSAVSLDYSTMQMRFSNDGATWSAWQPYAGTKSWTLSSGDGLKTIAAEFEDEFGNVLDTSAAIQLDTAAPQVTSSADADTAWHNGDVIVTLSPNDGSGSGIQKTQYRPSSSGTWLDTTGNQFTIPAAGQNGPVTYQYLALDNAGNQTIKTLVLKFDTTPPTVSDDADSAWHNGAVTVRLSPADTGGSAVAGTQYRLQGSSTWLAAAGNAFTVPAPSDGSGDGTRTYQYRALDGAGNPSSTGTSTVRIDTQGPTVTPAGLQSDTSSGWRSTDQVVSLVTRDAGSGAAATYYTLDGGAQQIYSTPFAVSGSGQHAVDYWAADVLGNVTARHTSYVNIDETKPQPVAPFQARVRRGGIVTLRFRVNDGWPKTGTATVTLKITASKGRTLKTVVFTGTQVNTPLTYRFRCTFKRGTYRFSVSAKDAAGNSQSVVASNKLVVR